MKNEVSVVSLNWRFKKIERGIEDAARFFLEALGKGGANIEIFLVSDRKMRTINLKHRDKDSSTNVLAFEAPSDFPNADGKKGDLGEVYLGPTYIKKHNEDINYMLLHGMLHLFGFNHENKSDRIRMEKIEEDFIAQWLNNKF